MRVTIYMLKTLLRRFALYPFILPPQPDNGKANYMKSFPLYASVLLPFLLNACSQETKCPEIKVQEFEFREDQLLHLGGKVLEGIPLSETGHDDIIIYEVQESDLKHPKRWETHKHIFTWVFNNELVNFKIYLPGMQVPYIGNTDGIREEGTVAFRSSSALNVNELNIQRWYDENMFAIELYGNIYLIDSADCRNCTHQPTFQEFSNVGMNDPNIHYLSYGGQKFLLAYFDESRWQPWLWVFDITDTNNLRMFGFEDSFGPPEITDINNDGKLDLAILQPGTACDPCDSALLFRDSIYIDYSMKSPTPLFDCQKLLFYTYTGEDFKLLTNEKGIPYYINESFCAFYFFPVIPLSNNFWKKIN